MENLISFFFFFKQMNFPNLSRMAIVKGTAWYIWMTIISYPRRPILNLLRRQPIIAEAQASISVQSSKKPI